MSNKQETLPKALPKTDVSRMGIQQASDNNDIPEQCPKTFVNKTQEISENQILQKTYEEKLTCL